jgi:hypothetical protein
MASPYARGAVTGIGIVTTIAGLREVGALIVARAARRARLDGTGDGGVTG